MSNAPTFQYSESLRLTVCTDCQCIHAIPRPMFLKAAAERLTVHCPAGHVYTPGDASNPSSNALQNNIELTAELADVRSQLAVASRMLAAIVPAAHTPNKELLRRARALANRTPSTGNIIERKTCPLCGKEKKGGNLANHLRRSHTNKLAEMDAAAFD